MSDEQPTGRSQKSRSNKAFSADYLFSFPERLVRSMAAIVGGTSLVLTNTLFPNVLKESTTYKVLIGNLQKYTITRIAQVPMALEGLQDDFGSDYLRQKMAGNMLEAIGLLTIRFSPLWIFAIAGDAAGGSKVFLYRLVEHLKANDVISQDADPQNMVDLLEAVQAASYSSATTIDTPPLSREELSAVADELATDYVDIFTKSQSLLPRLESIQERMDNLASEERFSVEELSGMMAVDLAALVKKSANATVAAGKAGAELFGEQILASYIKTLDQIHDQGIADYLNETMLPFLGAAVHHLDPAKRTWTEDVLLGNKTAK
jgi:hypothetical protein